MMAEGCCFGTSAKPPMFSGGARVSREGVRSSLGRLLAVRRRRRWLLPLAVRSVLSHLGPHLGELLLL